MDYKVKPDRVQVFRDDLRCRERAPATVQKYVTGVRRFLRWLGDQPVTPDRVAAWKLELSAEGLTPATVNGLLAGVNRFFMFLGWNDCCVKLLRVQRSAFREKERELTRDEYLRLLDAARRKDSRLFLMLQTLGSTGIRVSELAFVTVEAVARGQAVIALKGKVRTILFPTKLCKLLQKYVLKQKIKTGPIFAPAPAGRWAGVGFGHR